jgi:hypothetical protein
VLRSVRRSRGDDLLALQGRLVLLADVSTSRMANTPWCVRRTARGCCSAASAVEACAGGSGGAASCARGRPAGSAAVWSLDAAQLCG